MANFETAFKRTAAFEGGYVNDKDDSGGETYKGISRNNNSGWAGWKIIDIAKKQSNFPKSLDSNEELQQLVYQQYRQAYWAPLRADDISNQAVANDLYDTGVNMGVKTSIKLAQRQWGMTETGVMTDELLAKLNTVV